MIAELLRSILHVSGAGAGTLVQSSSAQASPPAGAGFSAGTLILCVLMLLILVACALTAFKIYVAIRGGKIAQGWLWFVAGFGLLGLAQLVLFAAQTGFLPVSQMWGDSLRAIALVAFLVGAGRLRKLLT
jgi:hypothetical protein